jgi:BASS family bile acid:Na+ symporter
MRLSVSQILAPLRDFRLVLLTLLANFVAVPLFTVGLSKLLGLNEPQAIGLILLGAAAGAPFLPRVVEAAKGDLATSVSLMVLLMIGSLAYLPLALPMLLPGVSVDSFGICRSLLLTILLPLAVGLVLKSRFENSTRWILSLMSQISNITLILALIIIPAMDIEGLLAIVCSRGLAGGLLFVVIAFACGYFMAPSRSMRSVLGFATVARNIPAALLVGNQNFSSNVTTMVIVGALCSLAVIVPLIIGIRRLNESHTELRLNPD